ASCTLSLHDALPICLGHDYQIKGYRIAGKTTTAQIGGAHGYSTGDTNYLYSFAGMAPAKNPKYIMYVTLRQPQNLKKTATKQIASVFNPTMKMLLSQQKVAEKVKKKVITMPKDRKSTRLNSSHVSIS